MVIYIARDATGELHSFREKPILFSRNIRHPFWADRDFPYVNTSKKLPSDSHPEVTLGNSPKRFEI